ncbi:hypothetical protein D3C87_2023500 [compost metagenome]
MGRFTVPELRELGEHPDPESFRKWDEERDPVEPHVGQAERPHDGPQAEQQVADKRSHFTSQAVEPTRLATPYRRDHRTSSKLSAPAD